MKIFIALTLGASLLFSAVDINTANTEELASLKGIGNKKTAKIIKYRETKCFENIKELKKVKGINKKVLKKNEGNIIASECKIK